MRRSGSNVTAFSFIFVEYTKNIYGWSDSAPPGNQTRIITLMVDPACLKWTPEMTEMTKANQDDNMTIIDVLFQLVG